MLGFIFSILLLVAGFLLARLLFKQASLESKVLFGFLLIFSFLIIAVLGLNAFKITSLSVRALIAGLFILALVLNMKFSKTTEKINANQIVLLSALVLVGILAYYPHFFYKFPLHADEWYHLDYANKIIETGHLFTDPFEGGKVVHQETGFQALLAGYFLLSGNDLLATYKFLPPLAAMLMALALFVFISELTNSFPAGIISILLYGTLKSSTRFFGPMIFTPFMLALVFMIAVFVTLYQWINTQKNIYLYFTVFLLATMLIIHPSLAFFTLILVTTILIAEKIPLKKFVPWILLLVALFFASIHFAFKQSSLLQTLKLIQSKVLLPAVTTLSAEKYISYITFPLIFFVAFGLVYLWQKKKSFLFASAIVLIYSLYSYYKLSSYFIRPERLFFLALVFLVIIGSIGIFYFQEKFNLHIAISILLFAVVFLIQLQGQFNPLFHHYISDKDYTTLLWLKENYQGKRIFSSPELGLAIPLTNNYATSYIKLISGIPEEDAKITNMFEVSQNCSDLQTFIDKIHPELIVSGKEFNCKFLKKVYNETGFVYEMGS